MKKIELLLLVFIEILLLMSFSSSGTDHREVLFSESFEFVDSGYKSKIIAYEEEFNENISIPEGKCLFEPCLAGAEIMPHNKTGNNLTLVILYNESAPVPTDYREVSPESGSIRENIEDRNITEIGMIFPFSINDEVNRTLVPVTPEVDDPYKFRIVVYHESDGYARIDFDFGISTWQITFNNANGDSTNEGSSFLLIPSYLAILSVIFLRMIKKQTYNH